MIEFAGPYGELVSAVNGLVLWCAAVWYPHVAKLWRGGPVDKSRWARLASSPPELVY